MLNISQGKVKRPLRVVVDGVEGVGKSTFAAQFPDPLFIDLENGTDSMNVKRTQKPETWEELLQLVRDVAADPSVCRTLIVDTGDWAEALCVKYICRKYKTDGLESFGYGKGYVYLREEFENLLHELDKVIAAGVNVVICAHAQIKKFELPDEAGSFDRYELKMSKNVSPLVREWCDIQLFANFKTYVVSTENKHHKGTGGTRRVMYASHTASWDAKNRHGLPDEMELDFKRIAHLFGGVAPVQQEISPLEKLRELMEESGVTEAELRKVVSDKDKYPADTPVSEYDGRFITNWVIKYWNQILPIVEANRKGAGV
ncbi:MAG: ATP-binding protein [Oribacterium sp.]|uniref:ATP-binding protein n=1 Tax=Butyrivibrio sp. TaxID=28121 RepID=UPI001B2CFA3C|nr:ATP-binding protein [Butyrivibrio sp.]MBO5597632.1 ATP-binding protein [Oribacterium sp.]MBO6242840.1 ATP-binding protein [Butyrivibrio sp.]MBO6307762.1 ATP-binding protein [Oribacterium sp.]MBP3803856.1 ATP-binding protein [Oribacterium sp.]